MNIVSIYFVLPTLFNEYINYIQFATTNYREALFS